MRYRALIVAFILIALSSVGGAGAYDSTKPRLARELTQDEAKALLWSALATTGQTHLNKFELDYEQQDSFPRFFLFAGYWDGGDNNSVVVGSYLIDRETGDIWSAVDCEEFSSTKILRLKADLRKKIGLPKDAYKKIRIKGPYC
jgi:hypothetical protein